MRPSRNSWQQTFKRELRHLPILEAEIQLPIDLFDEAGMAIRLQAVAKAGASVSLAIGLSIGDFLALARSDPKMQGVALELLTVFLDELTIQGGVLAEAAFSAMAYANMVITGRLLPLVTPTGNLPAGFVIAAEYGVGLEAGAGYQVYVNMGFKNIHQLIRRSVDVLVDGVLQEIAPLCADDSERAILFSLRGPAKISLRSGFELGLCLASQSSFSVDTSSSSSTSLPNGYV